MSKIPVPSQQKKTGMTIIAEGSGFKRPTLSELRAQQANQVNIQQNDSNTFKRPSIHDLKDDNNTPAFKPPSIKNMREDNSNNDNNFASKPFTPPSIKDMKNYFQPPSIRDMKNDFQPPSINDIKTDDLDFDFMPSSQKQHVQFSIQQPVEDDDDGSYDPSAASNAQSYQEKKKKEVNYKPYTVEDYNNMKQADEALNNMGSLGYNHDEEWERKKEMRAKIMQFAKKTVAENKNLPKKKVKEQPKQETKLEKMKKYAASVPKPKPQSEESHNTPKKEPKKKAPAKAKYDVEAELLRHYHFKERVEALYAQVSNYLD